MLYEVLRCMSCVLYSCPIRNTFTHSFLAVKFHLAISIIISYPDLGVRPLQVAFRFLVRSEDAGGRVYSLCHYLHLVIIPQKFIVGRQSKRDKCKPH